MGGDDPEVWSGQGEGGERVGGGAFELWRVGEVVVLEDEEAEVKSGGVGKGEGANGTQGKEGTEGVLVGGKGGEGKEGEEKYE